MKLKSLFDRIICLSPDDHEAVHSRSVLRRQTEQHNHLEELDQRLADDPALAGRDSLLVCEGQGSWMTWTGTRKPSMRSVGARP